MEDIILSAFPDMLHAIHLNRINHINSVKAFYPDVSEYHFAKLYVQLGEEKFNECFKLACAYKSRRSRLRKRVRQLVSMNYSYFLTLTFTDEFINDSYNCQKKRVHRLLKTFTDSYIFNADYGDLNNRFHFHCIIGSDKPYEYIQDMWKYGFSYIEPVRNTPNKLSNYVDKLTNHSIKSSTGRDKVIYSRFDWCDKKN